MSTVWNGVSFPKNAECVKLPSGRVLDDAAIWPAFCQEQLGIDPAKLFTTLLKLPTWPSDQPIPHRPRGNDPHWIDGEHRALHHRGNELRRGKIWLQSDYAEGLRKYGYTGWQWRIANATRAVENVPVIATFAEQINGGLVRSGHKPHNHWIVTRYRNQEDNIGFHSDKDRDFEPGSFFVVIKLGAPRPFAFRLPDEKTPFLTRTLEAGTAVFVRCAARGCANDIVQHGVPPIDAPVGMSGSIVSRCIRTVIPWSRVQREITARETKSRRGQTVASTQPENEDVYDFVRREYGGSDLLEEFAKDGIRLSWDRK